MILALFLFRIINMWFRVHVCNYKHILPINYFCFGIIIIIINTKRFALTCIKSKVYLTFYFINFNCRFMNTSTLLHYKQKLMISLLCRICGAGAKRFEIPGASTIEATFNYCKSMAKTFRNSKYELGRHQ